MFSGLIITHMLSPKENYRLHDVQLEYMSAQPFLVPEAEPASPRDEIERGASVKCILLKYKNMQFTHRRIASKESFDETVT